MWDVWFVRIGKIALFAAGLVILLDIIGPDRLRRWGTAASLRRADAARQLRLARIERRLLGYSKDLLDRLELDIMEEVAGYGRSSSFTLGLVYDMELDIDSVRHRTLMERHRQLMDTGLANVPGKHSCPNDHLNFLCDEQFAALCEIVDRFIIEQSSEEEREAYRRHRAGQGIIQNVIATCVYVVLAAAILILAGFTVGTGLFLVLFSVLAMPFYMRRLVRQAGLTLIYHYMALRARHRSVDPNVWWVRWAGVAYRWGGAHVPNLSRGPMIVVFWQFLRGIPASLIVAPIAALLDKARPGHVLRWFALGLFVTGSILDLVGSW